MSDSLEVSLRAATWKAGFPVRLCNGEVFHFEPPSILGFYPTFDGTGNVGRKLTIHLGREFEECLESAEEAARQGGDVWPYVAWMADRMLTHANYRPEIRDHYREILYFDPKGENKKIWFDVYDIARGVDPKGRTSDG
jgi:hypothetical protein